jgi:hypothetical protein
MNITHIEYRRGIAVKGTFLAYFGFSTKIVNITPSESQAVGGTR